MALIEPLHTITLNRPFTAKATDLQGGCATPELQNSDGMILRQVDLLPGRKEADAAVV